MEETIPQDGDRAKPNRTDVCLDQNPPHLLVSASKSGRPRWVPLNVQAVETLEAMKARRVGERVFPGRAGDGERRGFKRAFRAICKRAGLDTRARGAGGVVPHTLRHTAISWMLQAGVSPYAVGKVAGHSAASMTERYRHLAGSHLADAVAVLDRPVGTPADTRRFSGKADAL